MTAAVVRRADAARLGLRTAARDMKSAALRAAEKRRGEVGALSGHLNALSPLGTLARGYSVARSKDGATKSSVRDFVTGEEFQLLLQDGTVKAVTTGADRTTP